LYLILTVLNKRITWDPTIWWHYWHCKWTILYAHGYTSLQMV